MQVLLFQEMVSMLDPEDESDLLLAVKWLRDMKASVGEHTEIPLDKIQRYMLLKVIARSSFFDKFENDRLLHRERSYDLCDIDDIEGFGVRASYTDDERKAALFDSYVISPSSFNPKKLEASAKHFYNWANVA